MRATLESVSIFAVCICRRVLISLFGESTVDVAVLSVPPINKDTLLSREENCLCNSLAKNTFKFGDRSAILLSVCYVAVFNIINHDTNWNVHPTSIIHNTPICITHKRVIN